MSNKQTSPQLILEQIRRNYLLDKLLVVLLYAIGVAVLVFAVLFSFSDMPVWSASSLAFICILLVPGLYSLMSPWYKVNLVTIARQLNRTHPELEESTQLFLKPEKEFTLFERLQYERIRPVMLQIADNRPYHISKTVPLLSFVGMLLFSGALLAAGHFFTDTQTAVVTPASSTNPVTRKEAIRGIQSRTILVQPPAYTGLATFEQPDAIKAPEGSEVKWLVIMSQPTDSLCWVLNEQQRTWLKPQNEESTLFEHAFTLNNAGFYYWEWAEGKSPFFSMEAIPDQAPRITVQSPAGYTEVQWGDAMSINLQGQLQDDYGLRNAEVIATVAKGTGESVKFTELKLKLGVSFAGTPKESYFKLPVNLEQLGLEWGDELYLYLQAWDNNKGYTRSETFIVQLEDTAVVESMDDMTLGVNPVPEYFRSQRQIIIDTEKLVKEQKSVPLAQFNERSNDIGVDQKILRLRYGAFLGEEFETSFGNVAAKKQSTPKQTGTKKETHHPNDGHDHSDDDHHDDDGHDHSGHSHGVGKAADATGQDIDALLEPYYHKHDADEAATFFEPAVKAQLKAALAQMWEAELRLRTYRPKEALPFEYKALRLLKEVQQSSRTYVRKTGFETPPIKEAEKRLQGELKDIQKPVQSRKVTPHVQFENIRSASMALEQPIVPPYKQSLIQLLESAGQELGLAAIEQPGRYMLALQSLRSLIVAMEANQAIDRADLRQVRSAFIELVPQAKQSPRATGTSGNPLVNRYFSTIR